MYVYEVSRRTDKRGVDLISGVLPFRRLYYGEPNAAASALGGAEHCSRSHDAVIHIYGDAGNEIGRHEHKGDLKSGKRYRVKQEAAMRCSMTAHCFG